VKKKKRARIGVGAEVEAEVAEEVEGEETGVDVGSGQRTRKWMGTGMGMGTGKGLRSAKGLAVGVVEVEEVLERIVAEGTEVAVQRMHEVDRHPSIYLWHPARIGSSSEPSSRQPPPCR
jgi:hypothetical protein